MRKTAGGDFTFLSRLDATLFVEKRERTDFNTELETSVNFRILLMRMRKRVDKGRCGDRLGGDGVSPRQGF